MIEKHLEFIRLLKTGLNGAIESLENLDQEARCELTTQQVIDVLKRYRDTLPIDEVTPELYYLIEQLEGKL